LNETAPLLGSRHVNAIRFGSVRTIRSVSGGSERKATAPSAAIPSAGRGEPVALGRDRFVGGLTHYAEVYGAVSPRQRDGRVVVKAA